MSWHSDARTVLSEQLFGDAGLAQDPGHWPWTFVGSLGLLAALTWAVLALPVAAQLGIVIGIAGSLFTLARPGLMVATFFMIRILMDLMWWIPGSIAGLNLMELYTGSATVLSAGLVLLHFKRVERHPALIPFIIYSMVLVIGGARNIELRTGAEIFARYLSPFIIMFAVSGLMKTREDRRRFIYAMTAVCAIPVAISLYQLARGQQYKFFLQGYYRLMGGYMNLHPHALSMVIIAALAGWWTLVASNRRTRVFFVGYAGAAALCLYFTYVRTGIVALGIFTSVLLWLTGRRRILVAGAIATAVFVSFTPSMQDRFKDILAVIFPNDAIMDQAKIGSGRFRIWGAAIGSYMSRPISDIILGVGIGNHFLLTREAFNPLAPAKGGFIDTHSDYLTMTFQLGPIATVSYLTMQAMVAWTSFEVWRKSPDKFSRQFGAFSFALVCAATAANVLSNAFINRITQSWVLWGTAGLTFGEYMQLEREGLLSGARFALRLPWKNDVKTPPTR